MYVLVLLVWMLVKDHHHTTTNTTTYKQTTNSSQNRPSNPSRMDVLSQQTARLLVEVPEEEMQRVERSLSFDHLVAQGGAPPRDLPAQVSPIPKMGGGGATGGTSVLSSGQSLTERQVASVEDMAYYRLLLQKMAEEDDFWDQEVDLCDHCFVDLTHRISDGVPDGSLLPSNFFRGNTSTVRTTLVTAGGDIPHSRYFFSHTLKRLA